MHGIPPTSQATDAPFSIQVGTRYPVAAVALHDSHALRKEVASAIRLSAAERHREEDPFTAEWTGITDTRLIALRSRFELDLNRPRDRAVYRRPEDAWGLRVWSIEPASGMVDRSLAVYDAFYAEAELALGKLRESWGRFAVLDLHSYNHRRDGPDAPPAAAQSNPEVNLGTSNMDRERWAPVIEALRQALRDPTVFGRSLDVRENVKFRGGHFCEWVHDTFPDSGCAVAIEFRKSFMDEWSGEPDRHHLSGIGRLLAGAVPGVTEALRKVR